MRLRLARAVSEHLGRDDHRSLELGRLLERELGINIITYYGDVNWDSFLKSAELRDVLDTISITHRVLKADSKTRFASLVKRILAEEAVGFVLDEHGVIHPVVDQKFDELRIATIEGLQADRYRAARAHLAEIDKHLLADPIDGREAVRRQFDAIENVFKVRFQKENQLNNAAIKKNLKPLVVAFTDKNGDIEPVAQKLLEQFIGWVESAHFYRHAEKTPDRAQPSRDVTLQLISLGYAHLRWLLALINRSSE